MGEDAEMRLICSDILPVSLQAGQQLQRGEQEVDQDRDAGYMHGNLVFHRPYRLSVLPEMKSGTRNVDSSPANGCSSTAACAARLPRA